MAATQPGHALAGQTILVVEDEYFLAEEVRAALVQAGAGVLGPFGEVAEALAALGTGRPLSSAVLDINLRGSSASPVAEALRERGIPFVFTTGYDSVPPAFQDVPRCEKPINVRNLVGLLADAAGQKAAAGTPGASAAHAHATSTQHSEAGRQG